MKTNLPQATSAASKMRTETDCMLKSKKTKMKQNKSC